MDKKELQSKISEIIAEKKPIVISSISKQLGVSDIEVCKALPDDMAVVVDGKHFDDVWQEMTTWESATFIVIAYGNVIEVSTKIPEGKYGHGYFNIHSDGFGIGGHINRDAVVYIGLASIPFMGLESHSVGFYNADGNVMYSIYVGRENKQLHTNAKQSFLNMKKRYAVGE